jgi:hypothetical protein
VVDRAQRLTYPGPSNPETTAELRRLDDPEPREIGQLRDPRRDHAEVLRRTSAGSSSCPESATESEPDHT